MTEIKWIALDGLQWQAEPPEPMPWGHAVEYVRMMNLAYPSEQPWRLPTVAELISTFDYEKAQTRLREPSGYFWSANQQDPICAWAFGNFSGNLSYYPKSNLLRVRLVRG